ncbi:hypothetical protein FXO38_22278 [Capsicum annuum]|nr:hypothetical protein FXO38_22278 [Capsicum annuum]
MSTVEYEKYKEKLETQSATISSLKRAYTALASSNRDLNTSQEKMLKRQKKMDKFLNKLWKGVKGPWNGLKPNAKLLSSKIDSDEEVLAEWSNTENGDEDLSQQTRETRDAYPGRPFLLSLDFTCSKDTTFL